MLYVTPEGEEFIHNGIHFYPISSKTSFGFRIRWNGKLRFFRFSKTTKKFHFAVVTAFNSEMIL